MRIKYVSEPDSWLLNHERGYIYARGGIKRKIMIDSYLNLSFWQRNFWRACISSTQSLHHHQPILTYSLSLNPPTRTIDVGPTRRNIYVAIVSNAVIFTCCADPRQYGLEVGTAMPKNVCGATVLEDCRVNPKGVKRNQKNENPQQRSTQFELFESSCLLKEAYRASVVETNVSVQNWYSLVRIPKVALPQTMYLSRIVRPKPFTGQYRENCSSLEEQLQRCPRRAAPCADECPLLYYN